MIQIFKKKSEKLHRLDLERSLSQYTVSKDTSTQINKQTQYQICSNKGKVHKNQKENVCKDCNKAFTYKGSVQTVLKFYIMAFGIQ